MLGKIPRSATPGNEAVQLTQPRSGLHTSYTTKDTIKGTTKGMIKDTIEDIIKGTIRVGIKATIMGAPPPPPS